MSDDVTHDEIAEAVIGIIAEQAVIDPAVISLDAKPEDLGVDSLGLVEAVFAIEERFDISVPFNPNDPTQSEFDISTVAAIVEAVRGLVAAQKGGADASGKGGA